MCARETTYGREERGEGVGGSGGKLHVRGSQKSVRNSANRGCTPWFARAVRGRAYKRAAPQKRMAVLQGN